MNKRIPVTVFTGFLGAGKTTLLNYVLAGSHGKKIAVIENEFGEIGVDDALVKRKLMTEEQVFEMNNGCICCTVRGDLIKILHKLLSTKEGKKLDAIFIETTGMADPAPVAQTFLTDEFLNQRTELDAIITVVDIKHIESELSRKRSEGAENEAEEQIAFADVVILNKIDLVTDDDKLRVKDLIHSINSHVEIIETQQCQVDLDKIIGIRGFNLEKILQLEPDFLNDSSSDHIHDTEVTSVGIKLGPDFEIDMNKFFSWMSNLLQTKGGDLLRYKGILKVVGVNSKYVFQGVRMLYDGFMSEENWIKGEEETRFIIIGKNLDRNELIEAFMNCRAIDLRFIVGNKVKCNTNYGWQVGKIIKCWDEGNAYRIRLDIGIDVWAPLDIDELITLA